MKSIGGFCVSWLSVGINKTEDGEILRSAAACWLSRARRHVSLLMFPRDFSYGRRVMKENILL
jgi:hypothetical protein